MNVGFYLSEGKSTTAYVLADEMVRSVRRVMDARICQFTDEKSSILYGVDSFVRGDGKNTMRLRLEHYQTPGEWLFLDTDLVVQGDVSQVFNMEFDIAISDRSGSVLPAEMGSEFMRRMPHNLGAVFSRSPEFWSEALRVWESFTSEQQADITSDQLAVNEVIRSKKFNVLVLDGSVFNLSPMTEDQDVGGAKIVHYKGARKFWMLRRLYSELGLAA